MSSNSKPYPKTVGSLKTYADEVGTYPLRALLVAGYVYDDAHEFADDITDELSGSGYARVDLDNVLYTATDSDAAITADDVVFASLTATDIDGVIVISDQGADSASPLVGYFAIGPLSVSTETLTVPWPSGQVAYFTIREATAGTVTSVADIEPVSGNVDAEDLAAALEPYLSTGSGPVDAEQIDRTSTTPGAISIDLSSVTKAGAVIFVDGASDVTVTALPDSSGFPAFFVYVARITGTGVCTLTFDGGANVYNGDQYTATSEADGQAAIGLVPLGSGDNWLVDSVFPAGGGGSGDVVGPASAVDDRIATFDTATGKLLQDGGKTIAELVPKSLYDANTILAATSDDTPVALTVGASTLLGRRASGDIAAISYANVKIDLGVVPIGGDDEGSGVSIGTSPSSILTNGVYALPILAAGDVVEVEAWYTILNNSGTLRQYNLGTKLGSTTVVNPALVLSPSATPYFGFWKATIRVEGTSDLNVSAYAQILPGATNCGATAQTGSVDVSSSVNLDLTVTTGGAGATQTATLQHYYLKVSKA